jgi:ClpP class serine protease
LATALEEVMDADVLALMSPIEYGVDDAIREAIEDRFERLSKDKKNRRKKLAVLLETVGGYIEVVARIAHTLRHHYPDHVSIVVPNFAYSAGTVLAMAGDAIYMDYYSVLGPIDPQVEREQRDGSKRAVPVLGYLTKYAELVKKSEKGTLTMAEANFLLEQFDPGELYEFEHAVNLTNSLLIEWLVKYKFKDWNETETNKTPVTLEKKKVRAAEIAKKLGDVEEWHSHARGISMAVLNDPARINLKIDDFGKNKVLNEAIRLYHRALWEYSSIRGLVGSLHVPGNYVPLSAE